MGEIVYGRNKKWKGINMGSFFDKKITCPHCMEEIGQAETREEKQGGLKCPECGEKLPREIFQCDQYINVCIVGLPGCGKTTFMTVMLREFEHKICDKGLYLESMNDYDDQNQLRKQCEERLYKDKKILDATNEYDSGKTDDSAPQFYRIKDMLRYNKIRNRTPVYSLTLLDGAGEDYRGMKKVAQKHIGASDYTFYLVDSTVLPAVQREIGRQIGDGNNDQQMVNNMAQYLRKTLGAASGQKIKKPVAVVLTKFDVIRDMMQKEGANYRVIQENALDFSGSYIKSDMNVVDKEIRSWLRSKNEQYFLNAVDANFSNVRFFGISSYGHEAKGESVGTLKPHRVLDPIMWVLSDKGIIHRVEV